MRWTIVAASLALSACTLPKSASSPYPSPFGQEDTGPNAETVFASVEEHAKCAGFHRAFARLASGTQSKAEFYTAAAKDAATAAAEIATAKISRELAVDMVDQLARTHAARWAYAIEVDAGSDAVRAQAEKCFEMASEQDEIIRNVVKAKYGFRHR